MKIITAVAGLALTLGTVAAFAGPMLPPPPRPPMCITNIIRTNLPPMGEIRTNMPPMVAHTNAGPLAMFDTDQDGTVTPAEFEAAGNAQAQKELAAFLARFDTDKDGTVTAAEALALHEAKAEQWFTNMLTHLDRNKDGAITTNDFPRLRRGMTPPIPLEFDTDGDGAVSSAELIAAAEAKAQELQTQLLAEFDTDADGVITSAEALAVFETRAAERIADILAKFDTNKDGSVTSEEIVGVVAVKPRVRPIGRK
jgi:hypothetical protein